MQSIKQPVTGNLDRLANNGIVRETDHSVNQNGDHTESLALPSQDPVTFVSSTLSGNAVSPFETLKLSSCRDRLTLDNEEINRDERRK